MFASVPVLVDDLSELAELEPVVVELLHDPIRLWRKELLAGPDQLQILFREADPILAQAEIAGSDLQLFAHR